MPRMSGSTLVGANALSANVLAGQQFEFLPRRTTVLLSAAATAIGLNGNFLIGGRSVLTDAAISGANRFPILPDDAVTREIGGAGNRLLLQFRNTTGAGITANWAVDVG